MDDPVQCDGAGRPLDLGMIVRLVEDYDEDPDNVGERVGEVRTLYRPGSDFYGFSRIRFQGARKPTHRVPNSAVRIVVVGEREPAPTWWTLDEVQEYLGHKRVESTEVWLSRHGIRAVRHYPVQAITAERERRRPAG